MSQILHAVQPSYFFGRKNMRSDYRQKHSQIQLQVFCTADNVSHETGHIQLSHETISKGQWTPRHPYSKYSNDVIPDTSQWVVIMCLIFHSNSRPVVGCRTEWIQMISQRVQEKLFPKAENNSRSRISAAQKKVKAVCGSYSTAALRHIVLLPKWVPSFISRGAGHTKRRERPVLVKEGTIPGI